MVECYSNLMLHPPYVVAPESPNFILLRGYNNMLRKFRVIVLIANIRMNMKRLLIILLTTNLGPNMRNYKFTAEGIEEIFESL